MWWCGGGGSVGDASGNGVDGFHYAGVGCCGGWWAMFVDGVPGLVIDVDLEQMLCALLLRNRSTLLLCNRSAHLLWFKNALLLCRR